MSNSRYSIKTMSGSQWTLSLTYIAVSLLLNIITLVFNALVAYALKKHKKTCIITFCFIFYLSISDVMVGATGLVFHSLWLGTSLASGNLVRNAVTNFFLDLLNYFFQTSGQLVFIIAIDRYIHMKYRDKYNTIMTQSRARLIMLFNVIFGILAIIPKYVGTKTFTSSYIFGITVFQATCGILIFFIYMKAYFAIRRQLGALQFGKPSNIGLHPNKVLNSQERLSCNGRCNGSLKARVYKNIGLEKVQSSSLSCASAKGTSVLEPQRKVVIIPMLPVTHNTNPSKSREQLDEIRTTVQLSCVVENDTIPRSTELNVESTALMESIKATMTQSINIELTQKSQRKMPKAQSQLRKAIIYIFLALVICYLPFFVSMFYLIANKRKNGVLSIISFIGIQLNSSLNAIIFIAFSKETQRNIKATFVGEYKCASHK